MFSSTSQKKLTILITGCSPGGIGATLAITLHDAGHHVFATARDPAKLKPLAERGITTLPLDISSETSIASAVSSISASDAGATGLDILVNNAAASYSMPVADISLEAARKLFDTNVWGQIAVTQAFLPCCFSVLPLHGLPPGGAGGGVIAENSNISQ
ncbi:hypothetical protein PG989_005557 [Apiospora arundinis]